MRAAITSHLPAHYLILKAFTLNSHHFLFYMLLLLNSFYLKKLALMMFIYKVGFSRFKDST